METCTESSIPNHVHWSTVLTLRTYVHIHLNCHLLQKPCFKFIIDVWWPVRIPRFPPPRLWIPVKLCNLSQTSDKWSCAYVPILRILWRFQFFLILPIVPWCRCYKCKHSYHVDCIASRSFCVLPLDPPFMENQITMKINIFAIISRLVMARTKQTAKVKPFGSPRRKFINKPAPPPKL